MLCVGDNLPEFTVTGVKPFFMEAEEDGASAFEMINNDSFSGKWKVIFFYPKDFTSVCGSEIVGYGKLASEFEKRNAVLMGGSSDNEICKLKWRQSDSEMNKYPAWQFSDLNGSLIDGLGIRSEFGVAYRATFIVDPKGVIQHVDVNPLAIGRNPNETLRILDALQANKPCMCNRQIGE